MKNLSEVIGLSKYTINMFEFYGQKTFRQIADDLFSGLNYNFVSDEMKKDIEVEFVKHFYLREIGTETFDLFKFYLRNFWTHLCEKYELVFNEKSRELSQGSEVFFGSGRTEVFEQNRKTDTIADTTNNYGSAVENSGADKVESTTRIDNTPQTPYNPGNYANNITFGETTNKLGSKNSRTGKDIVNAIGNETLIDKYTRTVSGNDVSTQNYQLLVDFLNIYEPLVERMMNECNTLFLQVW